MEEKRLNFEDIVFPGQSTGLSARGSEINTSLDRYENAAQIASDLKSPLLAELVADEAAGSWERDLSLLSSCSWIDECAGVVKRLIQLREISPLDIVGISDVTERVSLRPLIFSLALALRKLLNRVVLVDCDLRRPSLHTIVGSEGKEGFIDMVKYGCSFLTASSETEVEGLYVIGAGSHPVSSEGELVGRELERVFHSLRTKADIALVCVPPFLVRKQVNPFLNCMDGVILCLNDAAARKSKIRRGFSALWKSDIPVIGIVSQRSSEIEERETLVLRAHAEDRASAEPEPAAGQAGKDGGAAGADSEDNSDAHQEANSKWQPISSTEAEPGREAAPAGETDSGESAPLAEADLLEKSLFGKQKHWRQFAVGICVVLGIIGVLALKQSQISTQRGTQMDANMMRSIMLPGSDGILTADEIPGSQIGALASKLNTVGPSAEEKAPRMYVEVSSRANRDDAARDSAKVSGIGIRALILPASGERGRLYRVVAGPFTSKDEANSAISRMKPLGVSAEIRIITEGVRE